ncbi:hypothetical protein FA15DRAFT_664883 [Coprinopsis marcescibilis]|uniref:Uncharacterized protein n=1 Tax=Coprinopsis marcescibilis TaxID=230819 RepID=A0A5C3L7P4_COPMA|nr:hypothetical protein FA15DRAFT_664883 [Coprinopsis marcescibilis]
MSFNNAPLIMSLDIASQGSLAPSGPVRRRRLVSDPCLADRLPNSRFIGREAENHAPQALRKQLAATSSAQSRDDEVPQEQEPGIGENPASQQQDIEEPTTPTSPRTSSVLKSFVKSFIAINPRKPVSMTDLQPYQIMKAVDERDVTFLMEVRDKAFPLLLQTSGGETPLVHAIRVGHRDVAIVLLGAFSRWINRLEDQDISKAQVQSQLKTLRVGLKLAINEGLAHSQPDLIASFMQTLVMSEGDAWIWAQVSLIARALSGNADEKPVQTAGAAVRKFTTKELGKASIIATVEDYIANATADLLMMGAWSIVLQSVPAADGLPTYYFARDDRVYKAFVERLDKFHAEVVRRCPRRLRWQLQVLKDELQGRSTTFRKKIEMISLRLDNEDPGVV